MVKARRRSRLRASIQNELIRYFCAGVTARSAAPLAGINRNTAVLFFHKLREVVFENLAAETPGFMHGEIEVDESYTRLRGQPFRRKERSMAKSRSFATLQKLVSVQASIHNYFNHDRQLASRTTFKENRASALAEWTQFAA